MRLSLSWPSVLKRHDPGDLHSRLVTLPNVVTISGIIMLVPAGYALMDSRWFWAGIFLAYVFVSDALDGYLARWLDQRSKLGAALDPVRDFLARSLMVVWIFLFFDVMILRIIIILVTGVEIAAAILNTIAAHQYQTVSLVTSWGKLRGVAHYLLYGVIFLHAAGLYYLSRSELIIIFLLLLSFSVVSLVVYLKQRRQLRGKPLHFR